jgi:hypothetical protein
MDGVHPFIHSKGSSGHVAEQRSFDAGFLLQDIVMWQRLEAGVILIFHDA